MASSVAIRSIRVTKGRIICTVQVSGPTRTTPAMIERALGACPHLLDHACVNDEGTRFGAVADHTDIPHLMEHLVIELQASRSEKPDKVFCGVTRWTDQSQGLATIEMSFEDDLVALAAFKEAAALVSG